MRRLLMLVAVLCVLAFAVMLSGCGGGGSEKVVSAAGKPPPPPPPPTPDKIAFHNVGAGKDSSRNEIFTMYTNGTGVAQLTAGAAQGGNSDPTWNPSGTRICFTSTRDGYSRLYLMNRDGSGQTRFTPIQGYHDGAPDWAPSGDRIAFCRGPNMPSYLWVRDVNTGAEVQLAHVPGLVDYPPSWDPTGRMIVLRRFALVLGNPLSGLYVTAADGSSNQLVMQGDGVECPSWSPQGDKIAYSPGGDIWTIKVDPATGVPVQPEQKTNLTNTPGAKDREPTWSSDGQWIAFESLVGTTFSVCKVPAAGGSVTGLGAGFAPDWSPIL